MDINRKALRAKLIFNSTFYWIFYNFMAISTNFISFFLSEHKMSGKSNREREKKKLTTTAYRVHMKWHFTQENHISVISPD